MKKIISYSLYGDKPIYNIGCIRNAEIHKYIFNDWEMRVYYNDSVNHNTIRELEKLNVNCINTQVDDNIKQTNLTKS